MRKSHQSIAKVFLPPSLMNWTDEKLASLSEEQLLSLLGNLKVQRESGRVHAETADDVTRRITERLPARALAVRRKRARRHVLLDAKVALQLRGLAAELGLRYDLSAETARQQSAGTKGFKPQALTDKLGAARTSSATKDGRTTVERFISYRVRDSMANLAFVLLPDQPNEAGRYVLMATDDLLEDAAPESEFAPLAQDYAWSEQSRERMRALPAADFAEAKRLYEALIARVATKLE
jgi:hypothetical protein